MYSIVRDGKRVWPYCIECGCRLKIRHKGMFGRPTLEHFKTISWLMSSFEYEGPFRDAREHDCSEIHTKAIVKDILQLIKVQ
jgi:hypothetical protein